MSEKIKDSIDKIEPGSGAKERMYKNILKKAEKNGKRDISPARVTRIALPIAACVCIVILGVTRLLPGMGSADIPDDSGYTDDSTVLGVSPYVEVEDASAFASLGIRIDAPEEADNVSYAIMYGSIAEIRFSLDGHLYCLRASEGSDASGINGEVISREPIENGGDAELVTMDVFDAGECRIVKWTSDSIYFSVSNSDGAAGDELRTVFDKIKK